MRMAYYLCTRITLLVRPPKVSALLIGNLAYCMDERSIATREAMNMKSLLEPRDCQQIDIAHFMPALHVRVSQDIIFARC